jgi:hypothetical protein
MAEEKFRFKGVIPKDKDYYASKEGSIERLYFVHGIPKKYWEDTKMPYPSDLMSETGNKSKPFVHVPINVQVEWINKLTQDEDELAKDYLIGVESEPTEYAAMSFSCAVAKFALKKMYTEHKLYNVQVINSSELDKLTDVTSLDMLVIYNITGQSTNDRIQDIRDMLEKYKNSMRILVLAGCDPINFFTKKLYMPINGAFYFTHSRGTIQI